MSDQLNSSRSIVYTDGNRISSLSMDDFAQFVNGDFQVQNGAYLQITSSSEINISDYSEQSTPAVPL
jgi:hypothetical protein